MTKTKQATQKHSFYMQSTKLYNNIADGAKVNRPCSPATY